MATGELPLSATVRLVGGPEVLPRLLHAILTLVRRRENLFRVALGAFSIGAVFHFVSIMEEGLSTHHCPITNFY